MSMFVVTPSLADANAVAVCFHRPLQQHQHQHRDGRGLCLESTSPPHLSTCAIPHRSNLLGLSRGFVRGSKWTRRSLHRGPRANSETEERPSRADGNGRAAGGLDELDNQLRVLSSSENLSSSAKDARNDVTGGEAKLPKEEFKKVIWPTFGDGFVLYFSAGLILLTIINNVLFRIFIGPPVPRDARPQDTGVPPVSQGSKAPAVREERYKLRSSRDPRYNQNAPPVAENSQGIQR